MPLRAPWSRFEGHARPGRPRRRRFVLGITSTVLVLLATGAGIGMTGFSQVAGRPVWIDSTVAAVGFGLDKLEVRGNKMTSKAEVVAALALGASSTQLSFDAEAARRRIEALPWVLTAKVHRRLPDGLAIEIVERKPAIVWRASAGDVIIDMHGRVLSSIPRGGDPGLPVVVGEGAGVAGPGIVALIQAHPEIERRTIEARRIEDRRWTLLLASGTLLHLPGDGAAGAIAWAESWASSGLLDRGYEAIDLRVPGQLVIRPGRISLAEPARQSAGQMARAEPNGARLVGSGP